MGMNGPPDQRPPERLELMDLYSTIFDTWRSQVDSSWQRSGYFAAFETAAIGGCWLLVAHGALLWDWAAIGFSFGGLLLTAIWYLSTCKTWGYVRHWWDAIIQLEGALALAERQHDFATRLDLKNEHRCGVRYKLLVLAVPSLFGVAWFVLFVLSIVCCARHSK